MGFKIRAGLAVGGLFLSWALGLNFLSGMATYIDSTGNILVDIADGIGIVSKGIETLENYLDSSASKTGSTADDKTPIDPGSISDTNQIDAQETVTPSDNGKSETNGQQTSNLAADVVSSTAKNPPSPQPVICKKGKCIPYDPSKDRVLQQQLIRAQREKILKQVKNGEIPTARGDYEEDDDDFEDELGRQIKLKKIKVSRPKKIVKESKIVTSSDNNEKVSPTEETTSQKENVDDVADNNNSETSPNDTSSDSSKGGWRFGVRKILNRTSNLLQNVSTFLLKFVSTVFPWNRRARRRLTDGPDDEEL